MQEGDTCLECLRQGYGIVECLLGIRARLLLDSRVVDLPRSSNLMIVTLSSLKSLFFNAFKKALHCSDNVGAEDPGIP
jgi:hypothetical protein